MGDSSGNGHEEKVKENKETSTASGTESGAGTPSSSSQTSASTSSTPSSTSSPTPPPYDPNCPSLSVLPSDGHTLFVTSTTYPANFLAGGGTLVDADAICQATADALGIVGPRGETNAKWKALLSGQRYFLEGGEYVLKEESARDRIKESDIKGPIYNSLGELLAQDYSDLWDDGKVSNVIYNECGGTPEWSAHTNSDMNCNILSGQTCDYNTNSQGIGTRQMGNPGLIDFLSWYGTGSSEPNPEVVPWFSYTGTIYAGVCNPNAENPAAPRALYCLSEE